MMMRRFCTASLPATCVAAALLVLVSYRAIAADAPLDVPQGVTFEKDIVYSSPGGQSLGLDMARPEDAKGLSPAIVCIHGGGFRAGNRQHHDRLCLQLAQRGYVAVTVSYRLAPQHQFPAAVNDVKAAVRWLRANAAKYGVDPGRIGTTGDSAGGHLALFLGLTADVKSFDASDGGNADQSSRVNCVVDVYGPSDFTKSYDKSVDASQVLPLFLGGDLTTARHRHILASPLYWITPHAAPTLAIHGTKDPYVAHEQAVWLIDRLQSADVEAELLTLEGAGHGFKGEDAKRAQEAMFAFFDKHLKSGP
jgi:acetyl esterase/lipase